MVVDQFGNYLIQSIMDMSKKGQTPHGTFQNHTD